MTNISSNSPKTLNRQPTWKMRLQVLVCLCVAATLQTQAFGFQDDKKASKATAPDPALTADKELITEDEEKNFARVVSKYRSALRSGGTNSEATKLIEQGARIGVLRLSLKKNRPELRKLVEEVVRDIELHGKGASKELMLAEVHKRAKQLLDNHLDVRINAAILMRLLNIRKEKIDGGPKKVARPYQPVADTFIKIIESDTQHEAVKIQAVKGLERICIDGSPGPKVGIRFQMTTAVINELKKGNKYHWWYQWTCVRMLPRTDVIYDTNRKPFTVQILGEILVDSKRNWLVRSEAAKSIGRVKLDGQLNVELLAFEITNFCLQLSVAYNQNPNQPHWRHCLFDVYLSFKPENEAEQKQQAGLTEQVKRLPQYRAFTDSAYKENLKMINSVFKDKRNQSIPLATLQEVNSWVKQNTPDSFSVMQGMPSLRPKADDKDVAANEE